MKGKEKCSLLKKIRKMIAKKNGIPYETEECTAKGDCKGYCPKCDQEIEELNKALQEKESKKKGSTKIPKVSKKNLSFESEKELRAFLPEAKAQRSAYLMFNLFYRKWGRFSDFLCKAITYRRIGWIGEKLSRYL